MNQQQFDPAFICQTNYWHKIDNDRIQCDLCPRYCKLKEGQRGLCYIRANMNSSIVLTSYGRCSGFCIDPIEKKPLNHFLPGSSVLSFGTAGCNLSCKFCQNWDISKSRQQDTLNDKASPQQIAASAKESGCHSVAFTYNDPVIFHEFAIDVAKACHEIDIKAVAVSAGYVCPQPRIEFYRHMDAVNIDLKAFTDSFYHQLTGSHLQAVLDTINYIHHETDVWLEITTLLIPGKNDSAQEIDSMTKWLMKNIGSNVPLHFSAFHPDYKLLDCPATPKETLIMARDIAIENGLCHVYTGNVSDKRGQSSYCQQCSSLIIGRDRYQLTEWNLKERGLCNNCGSQCAGVFNKTPESWGNKRLPVYLNR